MRKLFTILLSIMSFSCFISCNKENTDVIINPESGTDPTSPTAPQSLLFTFDDALNDSTGAMYCKDNGTLIIYGLKKIHNSLTGETKDEKYLCISNMTSDNQGVVEESVVLVLIDSIGVPKQIITKEGSIILGKKDNDTYNVLYFDIKEKEWKEIENVIIPFPIPKTRSSVGSVSSVNSSVIVSSISMLNNLINALGVRGVEKAALGFWGLHVDLFGALNPTIGLVTGIITDVVTKGHLTFTILSYMLAKQDEYNKLLVRELGASTRLELFSAIGGKKCNLKYNLSGLEKSASIFANLHKVTDDDLYTSPAIAGMAYEKRTISSNAKNGTFEHTITDLKPGKYYIHLSLYSNKYTSVGFITSPDLSFNIDYVSVETGECLNTTDKSATVKYSIKNVKPGVTVEMQYQAENEKTVQTKSLTPQDGDSQITLPGLTPATSYSYKIVAYEDGKTIEGKSKSFSTKLPDISGTWNCIEEYYTGWNNSQKQTKSYSIVLNSNGSAEVNDGSTYLGAAWVYSSSGQVTINVINLSTLFEDSGTVYEGKVNDIKNPTVITGGRYIWSSNMLGYARQDSHSFTMTK